MLPVIVLAGPTAVGKTAVAVETALKCDAEIISADSRQVYKKLDIGTAKPGPEEQRGVRHHCIDIREPDEPYNAGMFEKQARAITVRLREQGKNVIVAGGTGLYLRAYLQGLMPLDTDTTRQRRALEGRAREEGLATLFDELISRDPAYARRIQPTDARRIIRALEVIHATGRPFSYWHARPHAPLPFPYIYIGLERPREELYARINQRVDNMISAGLPEEVRALKLDGYATCKSMQTVGYAELLDWLDGRMTLEESIEHIKRNTRRYAKRQITWFHKEQAMYRMDARPDNIPEKIIRLARHND
ncbi:MAG: tRNA (adenosine(37)-N6)-dimethylallyltransferase MiaA [Calditrichaeota bacterium]|nr:MAG: tRNA (adenosine(37)-N6)-dimethylallyltransferase MiaA [Calditrichota bacterium]